MPEEVHTTWHFGSNFCDMVIPGQNIIYIYTEKLETRHLLNLRARWMRRGGVPTLVLGKRMSVHLVLSALRFSPLLVIQLLARSRQDWSEVIRSLQSLLTRKIVVSTKRTVQSGGRTLGRSFMKSEKRVISRTEPCRTPEVVKPEEDVELDAQVTWELSERSD